MKKKGGKETKGEGKNHVLFGDGIYFSHSGCPILKYRKWGAEEGEILKVKNVGNESFTQFLTDGNAVLFKSNRVEKKNELKEIPPKNNKGEKKGGKKGKEREGLDLF